MSHPYQRLYEGPKKEKEYRRQLRQEQEATKVVHLHSTQSPKEQEKEEADYSLHVIVAMATICATCLVVAEVAMGLGVAFDRAATNLEFGIWLAFAVVPSTMTFILPAIIYQARSWLLWLMYWIIFFPLSCFLVHTWLDTHLTDKVVAKSERETPQIADKNREIKSLETSLAQLNTAMEIECRDKPNKPGSGNGDECKRYRLDRLPQADKSLKQAQSELKVLRNQVSADSNNDPSNASIAKVLNAFFAAMSLKLSISIDTVRDIIAWMLTLTVPCSGLILKEAVKCLKRRR